MRKHTHQIRSPLSAFRYLSNAQGKDSASYCVPILILVELAIQIQLEVHELRGAESHNDLSLVGSCGDNGLAFGDPPFIHSPVSQDVPNTMRVNLQKGIGTDLLNPDGG